MKTEITNPPKLWWAGDARVEPFMRPISEALERSGLKGQARTDVYNRAYEAVHAAIKQFDPTNLSNTNINEGI